MLKVLLSATAAIVLVAIRRGAKLLWTQRYIQKTIPSP
jgi:hypothetical protein